MKLIINITEEDYVRSFLSILSVGIIQCIKEKKITIRQTENLFFSRRMTLELLSTLPELIDIILDGTKLDLIESIFPKKFDKYIDDMKEKSFKQISYKSFYSHIEYTLENELEENKMELSLCLLKDYDYNVANDSIPIILKITSNTKIKLIQKWDILSLLFLKDGEDVNGCCFMPPLDKPKGFWTISKDEPMYLVLDLNSVKDSIVEYPIIPDEYQIDLEILVCEVINDKFKYHKLRAQTNISLK